MGKVKRARQKYHLERAKSMNDLTTIEPKSIPLPEYDELNTTLPSFTISDSLFDGIDIPLNFNRVLRDSDSKSIISTKSSFKERNLTKKEKRNLRHEAFMRKLDVIQQARKEVTDRKRRQKTPITGDMQTLADALPSLEQLKTTRRTPVKKTPVVVVKQKKSLLKAKTRRKAMLKDIDVFKKVLERPDYKADPTGAISDFVQEKIRKELMDE